MSTEPIMQPAPEPTPYRLDQRLIVIATSMLIVAFIAMSATLFAATTPQHVRLADLVVFFGSVVVVMFVIVSFVRRHRGLQILVSVSTSARVAFGVDVFILGFVFTAMIVRFFALNVGGYQISNALGYLSLSIVALGAAWTSFEGIGIATGLRSPDRIFNLLRTLNHSKRKRTVKSQRLY